MIVDEGRLAAQLPAACSDAGLDPRTLVVFLVHATRPDGTTPLAYLHPEGFVTPETVAVFRFVGAERVARHRLTAHRLAIWAEIPGVPEVALGPMLRHELEHGRRWERSGTRFFEADEHLRAAVRRSGGRGYPDLPSEREANAASGAFAAATLTPGDVTEVASCAEVAPILARVEPPTDVVTATLAQLAERTDWTPSADPSDRTEYLADVRHACAEWREHDARLQLAVRPRLVIERVPVVAQR
ncbi:MAG: hypothetical protein WCH31_09460 [Actinomycetes bacterium]